MSKWGLHCFLTTYTKQNVSFSGHVGPFLQLTPNTKTRILGQRRSLGRSLP